MADSLPKNIPVATAIAATTGLFAYLCPGIPPQVRVDILVLAYVGFTAAVPVLHVFNHWAAIQLSKQQGTQSK